MWLKSDFKRAFALITDKKDKILRSEIDMDDINVHVMFDLL